LLDFVYLLVDLEQCLGSIIGRDRQVLQEVLHEEPWREIAVDHLRTEIVQKEASRRAGTDRGQYLMGIKSSLFGVG
jgi:hypothetical protein